MKEVHEVNAEEGPKMQNQSRTRKGFSESKPGILYQVQETPVDLYKSKFLQIVEGILYLEKGEQ